MRTYIIIVHFGDPLITQKCLASVFNKLKFRKIIIIDNSQNFITKNEKIIVIKNQKNVGFAAGVNKGIKKALQEKADYILLLNNDTNITSNFLDPLLDFAREKKDAGIIGPVIKFKKEERYAYDLGGKINKIFGRTSHNEVNKVPDKNPIVVDYVSGCAMLIKSNLLKKIGLFDKQFFLYYEDVDFCLRAKKENFLTYVLPYVNIEHALSRSVGKNSQLALYHQTKSAFLFGKKYFKNRIILNRLFIIVQSLLIVSKHPKEFRFIRTFRYI